MGTLPLSFEQESPPSLSYLLKQKRPWLLSPKSSPSTPWLPSTRLKKNGTSSTRLSPRPLNSPWPRLLPAPLNSTTNIAVSMLVMRTPMLTSLKSSTPSSASTMDSLLTSSTPLTWTPPRSLAMLRLMYLSTLAESVSAAPSKDLVFPPASPNNNVSMLGFDEERFRQNGR